MQCLYVAGTTTKCLLIEVVRYGRRSLAEVRLYVFVLFFPHLILDIIKSFIVEKTPVSDILYVISPRKSQFFS